VGIAHTLPSIIWMRCGHVCCQQVGVRVPLVVRLEGTNVDKGKSILRGSGLAIVTADDLDDAAKKAVASIQ
jgi:succinyl-CoA synthetase beta subunit